MLWGGVLPPPKQSSFSRVSSLEVSSTNSSKEGSATGWNVLRDSVDFAILGVKGHKMVNTTKKPFHQSRMDNQVWETCVCINVTAFLKVKA